MFARTARPEVVRRCGAFGSFVLGTVAVVGAVDILRIVVVAVGGMIAVWDVCDAVVKKVRECWLSSGRRGEVYHPPDSTTVAHEQRVYQEAARTAAKNS